MQSVIQSTGPRTVGARNFRALWAGVGITNLADGVVKLTLPLVAVSMTDSPALVAGITLANTLPWLLFSLPAGVLADRVDRRRLIMASTVVRALILAVLVAGFLADALPLAGLYAGALALGIAEVFTDTTRMSVVPMVVPRNRMESAYAKLTATETVANEFIGPPLGGLLAAAGLAVALGAGGVGYAAALLALALMTGPYRSNRHPGSTPSASGLRADIREGVRYVWRERVLRTLLLVAGAASGCWAAWMSVIVVYAVAPGPLDLSRSEYGLLIGALGVGRRAGRQCRAGAHPPAGKAGRPHRVDGLFRRAAGGTGDLLVAPADRRDHPPGRRRQRRLERHLQFPARARRPRRDDGALQRGESPDELGIDAARGSARRLHRGTDQRPSGLLGRGSAVCPGDRGDVAYGQLAGVPAVGSPRERLHGSRLTRRDPRCRR
ncbi:MFS transporter [Micromonospora sp. WMMA1947]|uniref:MFS transporter n=1 Tax=Micromonospora sp. WMMA1947 TaxID=3015163 RepID=UPI00248BED4A|nr:MFS transporter [Micromonospora sp. WMMA1947]WBC09739.1 MFS transporter [Micromonospora sp. WMMA1947]